MNNVYKTPESDLTPEINENNQLASRWKRFWASMIDGLIIMLIAMPIMYYTGGFEGIADGKQPSLEYSLMMGLVGMISFILFNAKLLIQNGQTIGKKLLGIKIVDLNGDVPSLKKHLLARYAVYFLLAQVPIIGPLFSTINILFIFGKQKRCVHDLVAGTKVVKV
jgi:uncharacterized RDD family membrane protein YckC